MTGRARERRAPAEGSRPAMRRPQARPERRRFDLRRGAPGRRARTVRCFARRVWPWGGGKGGRRPAHRTAPSPALVSSAQWLAPRRRVDHATVGPQSIERAFPGDVRARGAEVAVVDFAVVAHGRDHADDEVRLDADQGAEFTFDPEQAAHFWI